MIRGGNYVQHHGKYEGGDSTVVLTNKRSHAGSAEDRGEQVDAMRIRTEPTRISDLRGSIWLESLLQLLET